MWRATLRMGPARFGVGPLADPEAGSTGRSQRFVAACLSASLRPVSALRRGLGRSWLPGRRGGLRLLRLAVVLEESLLSGFGERVVEEHLQHRERHRDRKSVV